MLAGLSGKEPETLDPDSVGPLVAEIRETGSLHLGGRKDVPFDVASDLTLHLRESLPGHPNGMRISAEADGELIERDYYSVGGDSSSPPTNSPRRRTPPKRSMQPGTGPDPAATVPVRPVEVGTSSRSPRPMSCSSSVASAG